MRCPSLAADDLSGFGGSPNRGIGMRPELWMARYLAALARSCGGRLRGASCGFPSNASPSPGQGNGACAQLPMAGLPCFMVPGGSPTFPPTEPLSHRSRSKISRSTPLGGNPPDLWTTLRVPHNSPPSSATEVAYHVLRKPDIFTCERQARGRREQLTVAVATPNERKCPLPGETGVLRSMVNPETPSM
jgi:hypothetical protein